MPRSPCIIDHPGSKYLLLLLCIRTALDAIYAMPPLIASYTTIIVSSHLLLVIGNKIWGGLRNSTLADPSSVAPGTTMKVVSQYYWVSCVDRWYTNDEHNG